MKIFNQRLSEMKLERLGKVAEQYQRSIADFLQKQSKRLSTNAQKMLLVLFCMAIIIYCVLLILQPLIN